MKKTKDVSQIAFIFFTSFEVVLGASKLLMMMLAIFITKSGNSDGTSTLSNSNNPFLCRVYNANGIFFFRTKTNTEIRNNNVEKNVQRI